MLKVKATVLEIDLGALEHNYRTLRAKLTPGTALMGVVKAFAYGSDQIAVARRLEALGTDYLAVAYTPEGTALREAGVRCPILVLHPQVGHLSSLIEHGLEPSLYSFRVLEAFREEARAAGRTDYPVHLKFNTGLNRLGFLPADVPALLSRLDGPVRVKGVLSHLAASEDRGEDPFTHDQVAAFESLTEALASGLGHRPIRHLANTSGLLNHKAAHYEMVRSGIGLYGFGNDPSHDPAFRPVAALRTVVSQLHEVAGGESVGYNRAYIAPAARTIATLPIGHADGIARSYGSNKGIVYLGDAPVPIVGNVCMDMVMVDVTGIPCQEGDAVTLFDGRHRADRFAEGAGTISYEILTAVSQRVPRRIIEG